MAVTRVLATLLCLELLGYAGGWVLSSYPNLEKFYHMEEEIMTLADVFLREEYLEHGHEDFHDLKDLRELGDLCKTIHSRVANRVERHLQHAINAFHLVKRLALGWSQALQAVKASTPCQKWHLANLIVRLENIEDNLPDEEAVLEMAYHLVLLQHTANISTENMASGRIGDRNSTLPLTVSDMLDLSRAASFYGYLEAALLWGHAVLDRCEATGCDYIRDGLNASRALGMLGSVYFKLGRLQEAINVTEQLIKIDPNHRLAPRNLRMYREYLESGTRRERPTQLAPRGSSRFWRRYLGVCSGERRQSVRAASRLTCHYQETSRKFVFEKMEVLNRKPLIAVFHGIFGHSLSQAMKYLGLMPFRNQAIETQYATPDSMVISDDYTVWNWTKQANRRFSSLTNTVLSPFRPSDIKVLSIGLEGMFDNQTVYSAKELGGHVGVYTAFLDEVQVGGEVVFLKEKVKVAPTRGSALFHFSTQSKMAICPAGLGTNWIAHQTYNELPADFCRPHEENMENGQL